MSVEQIANPTISLRDSQSGHVKSLVTSIRVLTFNHSSEMIAMMRSAECHSKDSSMQNAVAEDGDGKVVMKGFRMILLDKGHPCSAVPAQCRRWVWVD